MQKSILYLDNLIFSSSILTRSDQSRIPVGRKYLANDKSELIEFFMTAKVTLFTLTAVIEQWVNSTSKCKFRELFHKSIVWVN